jgi:hypothetical protein
MRGSSGLCSLTTKSTNPNDRHKPPEVIRQDGRRRVSCAAGAWRENFGLIRRNRRGRRFWKSLLFQRVLATLSNRPRRATSKIAGGGRGTGVELSLLQFQRVNGWSKYRLFGLLFCGKLFDRIRGPMVCESTRAEDGIIIYDGFFPSKKKWTSPCQSISSSSVLASLRSAVSKPLVNQP